LWGFSHLNMSQLWWRQWKFVLWLLLLPLLLLLLIHCFDNELSKKISNVMIERIIVSLLWLSNVPASFLVRLFQYRRYKGQFGEIYSA
jgi:bacteriorhodopsin